MKNYKRVNPAILVPLLLLAMSELAAGADSYGPPAPAGYMERISSWWSGVKSAVAQQIDSFRAKPAEPAQVATTTPDQPASSAEGAGKQTQPFLGQQTPEKQLDRESGLTEETAYTQVVGLQITPVHTQPVLVPKPTPVARVSSVPDFVPRQKKAAPTFEGGALTAAVAATAHKKWATPELNLRAAPDRDFFKKIALAPLNEQALEKVDALPREMMTLLSGLFAWLLNRSDEALSTIHALARQSKTELIQTKALAFAGWIMQEKDLKALSTLAFARAFSASPATGASLSYDNAVGRELSQASHLYPVAKQWPKASALEKIARAPGVIPEVVALANLLLAERAFDKGGFASARKLAQAVPAKTTWKEQARYLAATSMFSAKDSKENLETAGRELTELFRTVETPDVFDATATSLGRIHFILGNYKAAHQYLGQVSRDTNLYIEATVDNAWALLRSGDRNHAVGNMFTLHTPYFEGAYMPESFFLQSLGYQEICQFGDALTSVKSFKRIYTDSFKKLSDFNKDKGANYYDDLTAYLGHKDTRLSGIVLRELGRNPEFLRRQKILNQLSREESTAAAQAFPTSAAALVAWAADTFTAARGELKTEIAKFFKKRALAMEEELKFLMANISLLEYEIFAGAGQNLALQGAQNFAVDENSGKGRSPSQTFEEGKEYWPYEDEIWEDELNNFRSKIIDGCAKAKKQG